MKQILPVLGSAILLLLFSCAASDKKEITKVIDGIYAHREHYSAKDQKWISQDLLVLLHEAKAKEAASALAVAQSDQPTDKPLLIEGDIFSSLYEGSTGHEILSMDINENHAVVLIRFTNSHDPNQSWEDTLFLLKEGKWKLDNVIYGMSQKGTPRNLKNFLKEFNAQPL